jgi:hypothetical protein
MIDVVILSQCPDIVFLLTHKLSPSFTVGRMTRHWILEMMILEEKTEELEDTRQRTYCGHQQTCGLLISFRFITHKNLTASSFLSFRV